MDTSRRYVRTEADYRKKGMEITDEAIALEATKAAPRWKRDMAVVATYGMDEERCAEFEVDQAAQEQQRDKRPKGVAARKTAVRGQGSSSRQAKAFVEQVELLLFSKVAKKPELAEQIVAAQPKNAGDYDRSVRAFGALLADNVALFPPAAKVQDRLAEVEPLAATLKATPAQVSTLKAATVQDTADMAVLRGKLYFTIRDLNDAGRRAIRAGKLQAQLSEYKFHHIHERRGGGGGGAGAAGGGGK